jgi:hypothetical protein
MQTVKPLRRTLWVKKLRIASTMTISSLLKRSHRCKSSSILAGCAAVMVFCWTQSLSYLLLHKAVLEEPIEGQPWQTASTLNAHPGRSWFAVFDRDGERHIVSAWSTFTSHISPLPGLQPFRDVLADLGLLDHHACAQEIRLYSEASFSSGL